MARVALRDERGQLLLVAAIGLAVLFVSLALILNTAIYAEAVATDDGNVRNEREAIAYQHSVRRGVGGIVANVNDNNDSSYEALNANLSEQITDWNALASRQHSIDGAATNVALVNATNGTLIEQANGSRNFTNRSGASHWTPAENVSDVREFGMNVTANSLYEIDNETCTESTDCFYAEVENGSAAWRLFVYKNDSDIGVRIANESGGIGTCTASTESVWINLTEGTLGGDDCPHLSFAEGVSAPYNVTYANADQIAGSYGLTVGRRLPPDPHYDDSGSPTIAPTLYAATVSVTYRTSDLRYATVIRVEPGESDG